MGKIETLNNYIDKCKLACGDNTTDQEIKELIEEIVYVYNSEIEGLYSLRYYYDDLSALNSDLKKLEAKLINYRDNLETQTSSSQIESPLIQVNQANSNRNDTSIELAIDFNTVVSAVNGLNESVLSSEEKAELISQLTTLGAARSDKKSAWEVAGRILRWLSDKGAEVAIACLPYILATLKK